MIIIRRILPFVFGLGVLSCSTQKPLSRVRLSQPETQLKKDTDFVMKDEIKWTGDDGVEHIVTKAELDSTDGEYITTVELAGVTVCAQSKQVAERNGMVCLDFIVTVPADLINRKWQVQLTPIAFKSADTTQLEKIFLSGADFAKMQKKGYLQYQAFLNSIIPDSLYLKEMFDQKGYTRAMQDLEDEYFQAWKNDVLFKESWIDWSDRLNQRFILFNARMEQNKASIAGYGNTILRYLPAYWLHRGLDKETVPGKWKIFLEGNHAIRTRRITSEDSLKIAEKFTDYKRIAENQQRKEQKDEMYRKYVRFPFESARLDTIVHTGDKFVYYYRQSLPSTDNTKTILLTLDGQLVSTKMTRTPLPPSDTLTYRVSSMVQFLDRAPRYKKKILTRKDEVNVTAYVNYPSAGFQFDETLGNNAAEISKVFQTIRQINYTGEFLIDSIHMTATSSPEGPAQLNLSLSKKRAIQLKNYLVDAAEDTLGIDTLFQPKWQGEDWKKLRYLIAKDDSLSMKKDILAVVDETRDMDQRERSMRRFGKDYERIRSTFYPLLRSVEFKFHLHRRDMLQDTIVMPVIDTTYGKAIQQIENRQYREALLTLTDQYPDDYNTAICLMSLGYDHRALEIMERQKDSSNRNYVLAILYARLHRYEEAVRYFTRSCDQDDTKIWRGKLDPEINRLIKTYNLYKDEY